MSGEVDAFTYGMVGMSTLEKQQIELKRMEEMNRKINGGLMSLGVGSQAAIGNSMLASNTANTLIANAPLVAKTARGMAEGYSTRLEIGLNITQADNGFVIHISNHYGAAEVHIAKTIEEVTNIITSQLASRMLDRVK